jgi:hypothetical protein
MRIAVRPLGLPGIELTLGDWELGVIALGVGFFSAGLVAHVQAPAVETPADRVGWLSSDRSRLAASLAKFAVAAMLLLVILASLAQIEERCAPTGQSLARHFIHESLDPVRTHSAAIWSELRGNPRLGALLFDTWPWFPALALCWLGWQSVCLLLATRDAGGLPLDQVFVSATSARRFAAHWILLCTLLIAALPTLTMAGLLLLHHAMR